MKNKCLNCGGERLLKGVKAVDRGDNNACYTLQLHTYKKPMALLFKGTCTADLSANVCEDCGFVTLFAAKNEVTKLKEGYVRS